MPPVHLPAAQHAKIPWKNGLGVSRIVVTSPAGAGYEHLDWQVGATEIAADSAFSLLPGLDRLFLVIEGDGVELTSIDGHGATRTHPVEAMRFYAFSGDWKTGCRLLGGPVKVLNVLARRGKRRAALEIASGGMIACAPGETLVAVDLASLDAWRLDGVGEVKLPPGRFAAIRIEARRG